MDVQRTLERISRAAGRARGAIEGASVWTLAGLHVFGVIAMALAAASPLGVAGRIATLAFAGLALVPGWGLRKRARRPDDRPQVRRAVQAILGIGLLAIAVTAATTIEEAVGFAGFVLVFFAAGQFVFLWRARQGRLRSAYVVGAALGVAAIGLAITTVTSAPHGLLAVVVGIAILPIGVGLATEDTRHHRWRQRPELWAVGAMLVALGLAMTSLAGASPIVALTITGLLVVLIGAIAANTTLDIALLVIAGALVWAFLPTTETDLSAITPERGDRVVIALGDSYISGEGATRFYEGTNVRGVNECRRSPTAYPVQLAPEGGAVLFVACSGAVGADVHRVEDEQDDQDDEDEDDEQDRDGDGAPFDPTSYAQSWGSQVDFARAAVDELDLRPTAIVVSIGGNDAGFSRIGITCGLPGDCSHLGARWLEDLADIDAVLHETYGGIAELAIDLGGIPVVVVPYPVPINDVGCDWSVLTRDEHQFLAGYARQLNRVVRRNAEAWGFHHVTDVQRVLGDRRLRICDGPPRSVGINAVAANPVTGAFTEQLSPATWFRNSFHPNTTGHDAIASVVAPVLDRADELAGPSPDPPPAGTTTSIASIDTIMREGFGHCDRTDRRPDTCRATPEQWVVAHIARTLWLAAVPLLLVALGAWLVWIWALDHRDRTTGWIGAIRAWWSLRQGDAQTRD